LPFYGTITIDTATGVAKSARVIKPYLMDLGSTHKTFLNGKEIEDARYYELREKDSIRFAGSTREYVLLHDASTEGN
jgi:smad nuclear-interacting protein 1